MIPRRASCIVLALILATATYARLHRLTAGSFWFDEQGSVASAQGHLADSIHLPIGRVMDRIDLSTSAHAGSWANVWNGPDVHPPLYPLLLRAWIDCVGNSDYAVRLFSVIASLAAIVLLFDLANTLSGTTPALWACAIMAFAQPQIEMAQEARNYTLWEALALGAAAAAARLIVRGPNWRRSIALVICLAAMLTTHYFAVLTAGALIGWCALYLRGKALRQTIAVAIIALILFSPVAIHVAHQLEHQQTDAGWMKVSPDGHIAGTFRALALLPATLLSTPWAAMDAYCYLGAIAYFLPLLLLSKRWPPPGGRRAMIFIALWFWAGTLGLGAIDLILTSDTLSFPRFFLVASPALYLLIASLPLGRIWKHLAPAAAVLGCVCALQSGYDPTWKGDWRHLGFDVRNVARAGDVIVFAGEERAWLTSPKKLYLGVEHYAEPIPCPVLILDGTADEAARTRLGEARHVWLVLGQGGGAPETYLPKWEFRAVAPPRLFVGRLLQATHVPGTRFR